MINTFTEKDGLYTFPFNDALVLVHRPSRNKQKHLGALVEIRTPDGQALLAAQEGKLGTASFQNSLARTAAMRNSGEAIRYNDMLLDVFMALQREIPMDPPPLFDVEAMSNIPPVAVRWLWPQYFPAAKLSLIMGDPGVGKSSLTLDIAARITLGGPWPDRLSRAPVGHVTLVSAEDDAADTIRPRLDRLGANVGKIAHIAASGSQGGKTVTLSLSDHLPVIENTILANQSVLLIVDPLSAFMGGRTDDKSTADVRSVLLPLGEMAGRTGCAVLAVMHPNKNSKESKVLYRGAGSLAYIAAARAAFAVGKDPDHEETKGRGFAPLKTNLAVDPPALRFHITSEGVAWDGEAIGMVAERLFDTPTGEPSKREDAEAFLKEYLGQGAALVHDCKAAAKDEGITTATLRRAREKLGVRTWQDHPPGLKGGGDWFYGLPEGEAQA